MNELTFSPVHAPRIETDENIDEVSGSKNLTRFRFNAVWIEVLWYILEILSNTTSNAGL